jgi:hypothetical protein
LIGRWKATNRKDLSQLYYLKREIRSDEQRLQDLRDAATKITQSMSGMPGSGKKSDKTAIAAEIADLESIIRSKNQMCVAHYNRIMRYVAEIDDSFMRQIIVYRHVDLMKWRDIAQKIGGGNTEDGIRKAYTRYIEKERTQV